jgi:hypothetical protein
MKITKISLAFFVCFTVIFGSCNSIPHRIAVSESFLKTRESYEFERAKFYISADTEFIMYNNQYNDRVGVDGVYYTNTVPESMSVLIKKDDPGTFVPNKDNLEKDNWEKIEVKFPKNGDIFLTFLRVRDTYQYELYSARTATTELILPTFKSAKPLLQIIHVSGKNPDSIPPDPEPTDPGTIPPHGEEDEINPRGSIIYSEDPTEPGEPPSDINNVLDKGKLTIADVSAIADFICEKNPKILLSAPGDVFDRSSVVEIIKFYFIEAALEGINPDLAIAQVIQNLQYFSESRRYKDFRQAHNYGAIEKLKSFKTTYWDGSRFISRQKGIQAHIQFLKRLASGKLNDELTPIVLPNWNDNDLAKAAGTRKTLGEISRSWGGSGYAKNVRDIYNKLFEYVSARRTK